MRMGWKIIFLNVWEYIEFGEKYKYIDLIS